MKNLISRFAGFLVLIFGFTAGRLALADGTDLPVGDFLSQVLEALKSLGGLPWAAKIALICTLLVSSMKVTFLRTLIWDRLGALKVLVAPALALVIGIAGLAAAGTLTWPGIVAYFLAGAGAIVLHQILDAVKSIPGLGDKYKGWIDAISKLLGGKSGASSQVK